MREFGDMLNEFRGMWRMAVCFLALMLLGEWLVLPNSIRDPLLYSYNAKVDVSNVHVDPKPHDCDWSHAPIGIKHCNYEANVKCEKEGKSGRIELTEKQCSTEAKYVYVTWIKRQD